MDRAAKDLNICKTCGGRRYEHLEEGGRQPHAFVIGHVGEPEHETEGLNFEGLMNMVDQFREVTRAMVAGLVTDGFTDREAHACTAGFFASMYRADDNEEED